MKKPLILPFALIIGFSTIIFAQNNFGPSRIEPAFFVENDEPVLMTRPRIVPGKSVVEFLPKPVTTVDLEQRAFELLNERRRELGLSTLVWNDDVAKIARLHSQNMAENKFFSHRGLDGSMVNDRADKNGMTKWRAIGENIAYLRGYENPVEFAITRWMQSTSHRENLLDKSWRESAVGIAITPDGTYYFTQVFLLRK